MFGLTNFLLEKLTYSHIAFTLFRKGDSVTYVLTQMCYLCLEPVPLGQILVGHRSKNVWRLPVDVG